MSYISHLLVAVDAFIWPPATINNCNSFDSEHPKADLAQFIGALKDISWERVTYLTVENTLELWTSYDPPIIRHASLEIGITLDK
jgi:hypothetical protein